MENYWSREIINGGCDQDIEVAELARLVGEIVGLSGGIVFGVSKPDGAQRKLFDVSRERGLGWHPNVRPNEGIEQT